MDSVNRLPVEPYFLFLKRRLRTCGRITGRGRRGKDGRNNVQTIHSTIPHRPEQASSVRIIMAYTHCPDLSNSVLPAASSPSGDIAPSYRSGSPLLPWYSSTE